MVELHQTVNLAQRHTGSPNLSFSKADNVSVSHTNTYGVIPGDPDGSANRICTVLYVVAIVVRAITEL
jgi:hypothetical protein